MAIKALQFLYGSVTQGSSDAFISGSIVTSLAAQTKLGYRLREIIIEIGAAGSSQGTVANANYEFAITRKVMTAMPVISERSLIAKWKFANVMTTSGMATRDQIVRWTFTEDDNLIFVEDPIYISADSASSSASNVFTCRLGVELLTLSELETANLRFAALAS